MVNHFQERMPRPIIGVAHSMGAAQLCGMILSARLTMTDRGLGYISPYYIPVCFTASR